MKIKLQVFDDNGELTQEELVDTEMVSTIIQQSKDLQGTDVFEKLSQFQEVKNSLGDAADTLKSLEAEVKSLINSKAKALFGVEWKAIAGHGFKITRSGTGSVYESPEIDKVDKNFVEVKKSLNSKAVDEFIKENSKLPNGIMYNPRRGEQIRITVNGND